MTAHGKAGRRILLTALCALGVTLAAAGTAAADDTVAPVGGILQTLPAVLRAGVDSSFTLVGWASDALRGDSIIVRAEYFMDPDPGVGLGTPMEAADGAFDATAEGLTAQVDCSAWTVGTYEMHLRAQDAAGNWSLVATKLITMNDGTPPGAITNLTGTAFGSFEGLVTTIHSKSSEAAGGAAENILDDDPLSYWKTGGTLTPETEYIVLDAGGARPIAAVLMVPSAALGLMPADFDIEVSENAIDWEPVAAVRSFKAAMLAYMWEFVPADGRYVRLSGPGVYSAKDKRYEWQIATAAIYSSYGPLVQLSWTAPASDGYTGTTAKHYDVRFSPDAITEGNWYSCASASGVTAPKAPGTAEVVAVRLPGASGKVFVAVKTGDDVPNWSDMSNVVEIETRVTGFVSVAPEGGRTLAADEAPTFEYDANPDANSAFIAFSSSLYFPARKQTRADGQVDRTIRFPIKTKGNSWTPGTLAWKAIKRLVCAEGALYWRLEGKLYKVISTYAEIRSLLFETGNITDLTVTPSHDAGGEEGVWPDRDAGPQFQWTDATVAMKYFYVDVSTDPSMPMKDKKHSTTICAKGTTDNFYTPTKAEWKKVRLLATYLKKTTLMDPGEGVLYWRVRAADADKALVSACAPKELVIDGGAWTLSDLDLSSDTPTATWTHDGEGIVKYSLEFSVDDTFEPALKKTIKVPAGSIPDLSYTLKAGEVKRLQTFAGKNSVIKLYYRVRGEDADKMFIAYSPAVSVDMP